jgi:hypothetical protein
MRKESFVAATAYSLWVWLISIVIIEILLKRQFETSIWHYFFPIMISVIIFFIYYINDTDYIEPHYHKTTPEERQERIMDSLQGLHYKINNLTTDTKSLWENAKAAPAWIRDFPLAAFIHFRPWTDEEKITILTSLGSESACFCPQCGHKMIENPSPAKNKLFVWNNVLTECVSGQMIAYSPTIEKAKELIKSNPDFRSDDPEDLADLEKMPEIYDGEPVVLITRGDE